MKGKNKKDEPLYFSLKEVCKLLNIKPHILDYWEKRIPEIKPHKIGKRKFFKKENLEMLFQIKNLLEEGYTLEGIRKKLFPSPKEAKIKKRERASPALFPELTLPPSYSYLSESQPLKKENLKKLLKEVLEDLKEIYKSLSA
ncbi:MAG: MerR family transcriptional regulator [Caldimicrobium sp.]|uniref:HTH merR-type domain-containing protein n=1 Tax=Caldimicrobium thiodismutans TaxID=1653476 RepID=A0A2N7PKZ1_9BACT|nr:MAG: hypothetical protein C0197_01110 [Caldimicrobium thiodismutans]